MRNKTEENSEKILTLKETYEALKYIADSPAKEHGGFDERLILTARSALHWLDVWMYGGRYEKKEHGRD